MGCHIFMAVFLETSVFGQDILVLRIKTGVFLL